MIDSALDIWPEIRQERNRLLIESDSTSGLQWVDRHLVDQQWVDQAEQDDNSSLEESKIIEWSTYRQELRDLPSDQSSETSYADITWPSEPA